MPIKPKDLEKLILADGWVFKSQDGSHKNYIHPIKAGKVRYHFITRIFPKVQKIVSGNRRD